VWTLLFEVADVGVEDMVELAAAEDQQPVEALAACAADQRSAHAFAFGAWMGVRMIVTLSLSKVASNARPNFLSRSWIRNRGQRIGSPETE
jgi:hypothetical protein